MDSWIPAALAIVAALLIAIGTVLRQRASAASGAITAGWWLGAGIAVIGFGFQAWALSVGSLLLVQPLIVLAVLFSLPMEAWADHRRPSAMEWIWGTALVSSVVVFLFVAKPQDSMRRPDHAMIIGTILVMLLLLVGLVVLAERCQTPHNRALCYGLAAGALFGVSALLLKALALRVRSDLVSVFVTPELYVLLLVAGLAVLAQQRGFGAGDLQTSFPAMNVMEPAVAMALGMVLLGESLHVGMTKGMFLLAVLALAIIAVYKLAQSSALRVSGRREHHHDCGDEGCLVCGVDEVELEAAEARLYGPVISRMQDVPLADEQQSRE